MNSKKSSELLPRSNEQFLAVLKHWLFQFSASWNREITEPHAAVYAEGLAHLSPELLSEACAWCLRNYDYFPSVAAISKAAQTTQRQKSYDPEDTGRFCENCADTSGWIQVNENTVRRCDCLLPGIEAARVQRKKRQEQHARRCGVDAGSKAMLRKLRSTSF